MTDCIFCKLANHEMDTEIVYEDDQVFAFKDADPQAPIHYLFIPKKHIGSLNELEGEDAQLVGQIVMTIRQVAQEQDFADDGYRVVVNCGRDGGQTVQHLHFHVMAGRPMTWPAG